MKITLPKGDDGMMVLEKVRQIKREKMLEEQESDKDFKARLIAMLALQHEEMMERLDTMIEVLKK